MLKTDCLLQQEMPLEYYFEEDCYITEWWNSPLDETVSIAHVRVKTGVTTRLHRLHGITERYVILAGEGVIEIDHCPPTKVIPPHVVVIPPGVVQRITNIGASDLVFLALCTPRFVRSLYEAV